jgi:hypothetical protein
MTRFKSHPSSVYSVQRNIAMKKPRKIRGFSIPPRGVEQSSNLGEKQGEKMKGGAKSGARGAARQNAPQRRNSQRGTNWKNLPPELKKLIATLLRPYKGT